MTISKFTGAKPPAYMTTNRFSPPNQVHRITTKNTKNLTDGVKYYYRLRGVCEIDGEKYYTPWSNQAIRTYRAPEENPDKKLIEGVQNTTMTARSELGGGYIRVKWTKSYGYKMDHFEIYRSTKKGEYSEKPLYKTPNGNWKSYKNTKSEEGYKILLQSSGASVKSTEQTTIPSGQNRPSELTNNRSNKKQQKQYKR